MNKTIRRNIAVPQELNDRMRQREDINWSQIACRAFEEELQEHVESITYSDDSSEYRFVRCVGV